MHVGKCKLVVKIRVSLDVKKESCIKDQVTKLYRVMGVPQPCE